MTLAPRPLIAAACLALVGTVASVHAQSSAPPAVAPAAGGTLLAVSARAEARRVPDVATVSAGVVTQAADANAALRANAEAMTRVMAQVKAVGIAAGDVQTAGINVSPQYRYAENQPPAITGYQASNTVTAKVRDLSRLGKVLDALVASGANQVNGPSFDIDQPEPAYDEARLAALGKARARAETYAAALGMRVLRIVSISEGAGFQPPVPMMRGMAMESMAKADTPVAPGENTLAAHLDVVFELGR